MRTWTGNIGRVILASLVILTILLGCSENRPPPTQVTLPPTPVEPASFPPGAGLLYSVQAGYEGRLCYFEARGIPQCPVVLARGWISEAKWSPDKSRIAYVAEMGSKVYSLWVVRPDGSEQTQVGSQAAYVTFEWRPDSIWLDYSLWNSLDPHEHDPLRDQRFVTNVETLETRQIANQCEEATAVYAAAGGTIPRDKFLGRCGYHNFQWSPDRSWLAIGSYLVEDGKALMQVHLVHHSTNQLVEPDLSYPLVGIGEWAPDNRWLLVWAGNDRSSADFLLDSETLELRRLPNGGSWSPDGEWLSFIRYEDAHENPPCLYVMRRDGTGELLLACALLGNREVFWSPDSHWVACHLRPDGSEGKDILVVSVDSGFSQGLTLAWPVTLQDWR